MNKKNEISNTMKICKKILKKMPDSRNNDMFLYIKVCEEINPSVLGVPFWYALTNLKEYDLPCIETVSRARRKLQEIYPELAATQNVEEGRIANVQAFKELARV